MSISKNYKKNIPVTDLQYYYYVCYEALNQNPQFHYDENVKFYKNTYRLLDENFNLIIDDRETREKAKNLIFFYSMYDKNIYSINKLTSIHLNNYDSIFYTKHKLFINCVILIISGDDCAMGCYLEGELVAHKRFHRYIVRGAGKSQIRHDDESGYRTKGSAGTNLRRYNAKEMDSDIRTLLKTWNQQLKLVKVVFYQGAAVHRGAVLSYFKDSGLPVEKLPFQMAARTGGVKHAYEELFRVTCHGTVNQFFHDLEENTLFKDEKSLDPTKCAFVSSVKGERRLEKQNFPSLNPDIKQRLHDALQNDDYNALMDIHESHKNREELVQYLSTVHSKLNEQTFLHYAVRDNLPGAVQALLEIGCDPQTKDRNGKVACELADKSIKQVFINFRLDNPLLYNWTKCHIPEPSSMKEEHTMKYRDAKEEQRRKVKDHRKAKRESKKIVY